MSADVAPVWVAAEHAVELAELLEVLGDWLWGDRIALGGSWRRFLGVDGYELGELRAELARFAFLWGGDGGRFGSVYQELGEFADVAWAWYPKRR